MTGREPETSVTGPIVRATTPVSGSSSTSRLGGTRSHEEEPSGRSGQVVVACVRHVWVERAGCGCGCAGALSGGGEGAVPGRGVWGRGGGGGGGPGGGGGRGGGGGAEGGGERGRGHAERSRWEVLSFR